MFTRQFFRHPQFQLPQKWWEVSRGIPDVVSVSDHLRWLCGLFISELEKVRADADQTCGMEWDEIVRLTKLVVAGMNETLDALLCGKRAEAYAIFSRTCDLGQKKHYGYPVIPIRNDRPLYRARVDKKQMLNRRDLFHIPFDLRHKVASQRFSVPGLPCLYFGESLMCCWRELDSPSLNDFHFSRFCVPDGKQINIVDFNFNLGDLANKGDDFQPGYVIWWPLLAACSMERKHDGSASFHEEYLIPQLFTELISKREDIDGIRYFSCRDDVHARMADNSNRINEMFINLAVPSKSRSSRGYCRHLLGLFDMTDPISWQVAHTALVRRIGHDPMEGGEHIRFRLSENLNLRYDHTIFYQMECFAKEDEVEGTLGPLCVT